MTAARRERKPGPGFFSARAVFAAVGLALAAIGVVPLRAGAATTEVVVTDRYSGLAIYGYDPVAYFTDSAARPGRGEFELSYAGVVWRFCNEGNRAAFAANPEAYMPRFGGHDPMGIARGSPTPGHPELWLVVNDRLYLFFSDTARREFAKEADHDAAAAERRWPEVRSTLAP
jgi:YHS domain-containing protein